MMLQYVACSSVLLRHWEVIRRKVFLVFLEFREAFGPQAPGGQPLRNQSVSKVCLKMYPNVPQFIAT